MKSKKIVIPIIAVFLALVIGVVVFIVIGANSPERKLSRQLDLGAKYLSEENYEQAIAAFDVAISIDPKNVGAYLGKADAYIGMANGEMEKAKTYLANGDMEGYRECLKNAEDYYKEALDAANDCKDNTGSSEADAYIDKIQEYLDIIADESNDNSGYVNENGEATTANGYILIDDNEWAKQLIEMYKNADENVADEKIPDFLINTKSAADIHNANTGYIYYYGELADGIPNGIGVAVFSWGTVTSYVGEWKDGVRDGYGISTFSSRDDTWAYSQKGYYIGEWKADEMEGKANLYEWMLPDDGDKRLTRYEGTIENKKCQGIYRMYYLYPEDDEVLSGSVYYYEYYLKDDIPQSLGELDYAGGINGEEIVENAYAYYANYDRDEIYTSWHAFAGIHCSACDVYGDGYFDDDGWSPNHACSDYDVYLRLTPSNVFSWAYR